MKLICYVMDGFAVDIVPATPSRAWMDGFFQKFPYGCLPMQIANTHGWEIRAPIGFTAIWNGGPHRDGIVIVEDEPGHGQILSRFGGGILSFRIPAVFRTEPGFDLYIQGPPNHPKDGVAPLSGVVETDWATTVISMSWQITRPKFAVRFAKGEPLCQIFPLRRGEIEATEPEMRALADEPALADAVAHWSTSRNAFNEAVQIPDSDEARKRWPGHYRRGEHPDGARAPETHLTRLALKPFERK